MPFHDHHLSTAEDHVAPGRELRTHRPAWSLLFYAILAAFAVWLGLMLHAA